MGSVRPMADVDALGDICGVTFMCAGGAHTDDGRDAGERKGARKLEVELTRGSDAGASGSLRFTAPEE